MGDRRIVGPGRALAVRTTHRFGIRANCLRSAADAFGGSCSATTPAAFAATLDAGGAVISPFGVDPVFTADGGGQRRGTFFMCAPSRLLLEMGYGNIITSPPRSQFYSLGPTPTAHQGGHDSSHLHFGARLEARRHGQALRPAALRPGVNRPPDPGTRSPPPAI